MGFNYPKTTEPLRVESLLSITIDGGKHALFLLVMYGFCWNNVLYITILSFIFFLTAFDTKGCYYFESNLSLVLLIKVSLTKKKDM